MPYTLRKVSKRNCYRVTNRNTKRIMAKCTSRAKAKKQLRLLNAIMYNKDFKPKRRTQKMNK